jgi:hypothetical protein
MFSVISRYLLATSGLAPVKATKVSIASSMVLAGFVVDFGNENGMPKGNAEIGSWGYSQGGG